MDGGDELMAVGIESVGTAAPDLATGRANIQELFEIIIAHPKHTFDVFGHLPETLFAFAQGMAGLLLDFAHRDLDLATLSDTSVEDPEPARQQTQAEENSGKEHVTNLRCALMRKTVTNLERIPIAAQSGLFAQLIIEAKILLDLLRGNPVSEHVQ